MVYGERAGLTEGVGSGEMDVCFPIEFFQEVIESVTKFPISVCPLLIYSLPGRLAPTLTTTYVKPVAARSSLGHHEDFGTAEPHGWSSARSLIPTGIRDWPTSSFTTVISIRLYDCEWSTLGFLSSTLRELSSPTLLIPRSHGLFEARVW